MRVSAVIGLSAAALVAAQDAAPVTPAVDRPQFKPSTVDAVFFEQFADGASRWSPSEAKKEKAAGATEEFSYVGKWEVEEPTVFPGLLGDKGLVAKSKAAHHAISVPFDTALDTDGKDLVVQYEVKLQQGLECGGGYIKLLTESPDGIQAKEFSDKTPYTIMFGPDKCGYTGKVHFIFRHKNPKTGVIEEKHFSNAPQPRLLKSTTLYTLIVRKDQTFEIKINDVTEKSGHLLEDFAPAVNPEKEIDDASDSKPEDWVDDAQIVDSAATKPEDWDEDAPREIEDDQALKPEGWLDDEPATIPDPEATKPADWDDEEDGDFIAPSITNPKCSEAPGCGPWIRPKKANPAFKGKWTAPLIDNPLYKGVWAPRKIANPDYFEDNNPAAFNKIAGIGIEIWTMQEDILFDNFYVGHSISDAERLAKETFHLKFPIEDKLEKADADKTTEELYGKDKKSSSSAFSFEDFKKDPVKFVQDKIQSFVAVALVDPKRAVVEQKETAVAIVGAIVTLLALLGGLLGVAGGATAAAAAPSKKTDAPAKDAKKEGVATPAANADAAGATKRKTATK